MSGENVYTCSTCGGYTVTVDIHEGVTPMLLACRASGRLGDCDGRAVSAGYPTGPRPAHIPEPAWEWYRPTPKAARRMSDDMRHHVEMGGLALRERRSASEVV